MSQKFILNQKLSSDQPSALAFLRGLMPKADDRLFKGLIDQGLVAADGLSVQRYSQPLFAGEALTVGYEKGKDYPQRPSWRQGRKILIIYEDEDLLVVDKMAGFPTLPGKAEHKTSALEMTEEFMGRRARGRILPVHRLDRDTSGLVIFARQGKARDALISQLKAHQVKRTYLAFAAGRLSRNEYKLQNYMRKDETARKQEIIPPGPGGTLAVTRLEVLRRFPGWALVEVTPETGLMHQIRLHMASIGHPLLGEKIYLSPAKKGPGFPRQALHAASLEFQHPFHKHKVRCVSPLPRDMYHLLLQETLRAHPGVETTGSKAIKS